MSRAMRYGKLSLFFLLGFWLTPGIAQAQPPAGVRGGVRQAPYDVMVATVDESSAPASEDTYLIGMGIYDITGPAAELGMMGYAMLDQKTAGLQTRLWSRALVIATPATGKRVALVVADLAMISQAVKQKVVARLKQTFGGLYGDENVLLSATHTHAGPGGYSHYALYNLTILGFDEQNFEAIVSGICQSIVRAHGNLAEGRIKIARGDLLDASINRSPKAYGENPAAERVQYEFDTDKTMILLRLERLDGTAIGTINWFAVHGTSMGNENLLISGDNKGYAAYLFEKLTGTDPLAPDAFVAAFAQSNAGDVTPNILGGTNGGGANDFESTQISGRKQYEAALNLYRTAAEVLSGGVDYRHAYIKLDEVEVSAGFTDGREKSTCPAAIGISMLAGAEDGPGFGKEGWTCREVEGIWKEFTCGVLTEACQGEKPVVLEMGTMQPFPWTPEVLPLQILTIGRLALVAVPSEITTMAGRRLRQAVEEQLQPIGVDTVVIAGLANAYAGYVATREEYAAQHYEGASTHFGPWTLAAMQQEYGRLAAALRDGLQVDPGPRPRDLSGHQHTLQTGVLFDDQPLFKQFGGVHSDARSSYGRGDTAKVTFWGGHPKNNLKIQGTFLEVQRLAGGTWVTVARDWDWETRYRWKRDLCVPTLACSQVTIEWDIPDDATPGTYRIRHYGHWKSGWDGKIRPYTGTSRSFAVR